MRLRMYCAVKEKEGGTFFLVVIFCASPLVNTLLFFVCKTFSPETMQGDGHMISSFSDLTFRIFQKLHLLTFFIVCVSWHQHAHFHLISKNRTERQEQNLPVQNQMPPPASAAGGRRSVSNASRLGMTPSTSSAGRKSTVKNHRRGEEQIDIPVAAAIADGKRYYFVGGFSKNDSINALQSISEEKASTGTDVTILPGTYTVNAVAAASGCDAPRPPSPASKDGIEVAVRSLDIKCYQPQTAQPKSAVVIAVEADPDADYEGGEGGAGGDGADGTAGGADGAAHILPPTQPPITGDVVFTGRVIFTRYVAPADAAPSLAALQPEPVTTSTMLDARASRGMSIRSTASKKSVTSTAESDAAAAAVAAAARNETPSVAGAGSTPEPEVGARPSTWPTLSFNGVRFEKCAITFNKVHAVFERCHFNFIPAGSNYFVTAMPYTRVTFVECTFAQPSKAAVYGFPYSTITATQCHFSGLNLNAIQDDRDSAETLAKERLEQSSRGAANNAAVMADDATVVMDNCHVLHLTHGVVLQNRCAESRIKKCVFENIDGSAAYFGQGSQPIFHRNYIAGSCSGRGVFFAPGSKPKASHNIVAARTIISQGAGPLLKANQFAIRIEEQNDILCPLYMEPKY